MREFFLKMFRCWCIWLFLFALSVSVVLSRDDLPPGHSEDEHDEEPEDHTEEEEAEKDDTEEEDKESSDKNEDEEDEGDEEDGEDESQGDEDDEHDNSHIEHDAFLGKSGTKTNPRYSRK